MGQIDLVAIVTEFVTFFFFYLYVKFGYYYFAYGLTAFDCVYIALKGYSLLKHVQI